MGMPKNLVLVRHGESEGNVAWSLSKKGDSSMYTPEFIDRHSSTWLLTKRGEEQARIAGEWIGENIGVKFHRYYVSEYDRAKQSAALLDLPGAQWYQSIYLRERNHGNLDVISYDVMMEKFSENVRRRSIDPLYWNPDNGESLADVCLIRIEKILETLNRECDGQNVIIVCHGEIIWAFRIVIERMTHGRFMELEHSKNPFDKIHNCQIIHYTRQNPHNDPALPEMDPYLMWMRSICPSDLSLSNKEWQKIERKRFSNKELLEEVEKRYVRIK